VGRLVRLLKTQEREDVDSGECKGRGRSGSRVTVKASLIRLSVEKIMGTRNRAGVRTEGQGGRRC